jgi:hypothetical protein
LWRLTWPGKSPGINCFVEDTFYWAEQDEVKYCTRGGRSGTFGRLDEGHIAAAMDRYEQGSGGAIRLVRDFPFCWRLVCFDKRQRLFFLANFLPHLVCCLDQVGRSRWCECLGPGCCGGAPYSLPNDLFVTSGGCNGILSWLDGNGNILLQSLPHEGVGLATAYSSELHILSDGRVLVDGGPGLMAYNMAGELLWKFGHSYSQFRRDSARHMLVGCYWQNNEPKSPNLTHLECARGL